MLSSHKSHQQTQRQCESCQCNCQKRLPGSQMLPLQKYFLKLGIWVQQSLYKEEYSSVNPVASQQESVWRFFNSEQLGVGFEGGFDPPPHKTILLTTLLKEIACWFCVSISMPEAAKYCRKVVSSNSDFCPVIQSRQQYLLEENLEERYPCLPQECQGCQDI